MVAIHRPSVLFVMSWAPPHRTCTFCASGADTRKVTRRSECTQGYGAPGMFSEEGLHSSACAQQSVQPSSAHPTILINPPLSLKRILQPQLELPHGPLR